MSKKQQHLLTNKSASDRSYGETCSGNVDCRIPDILHSTVQQQDTNRREAVKKLIQQFENHPNKESFLQDLNKTEEINKFSEESKKLITDMGNTEIFERCETSSKKQCPDCNLYWGNWQCVLFMWEVSNTFAKNQQVGQEELRRLINSRLRRGAEHGASERQRMYCKAKDMLQKAHQPKHGGYKTILDRCHKDDKKRKSLSVFGWTEEQIIQYDELALEEHSSCATIEERTRNEKHWVLSLDEEGA